MAIENETDHRHRQQKLLQTLINEKRAELDRLSTQLQSLERIDAEQTAQLEKMGLPAWADGRDSVDNIWGRM